MASKILYLIVLFVVSSEGGEILTTCDLVGLNLCAWKLGQNISQEYDGELSAMPSPRQVSLLCRFRPEYKMCYQGKLTGCSLNLVYLATLGTTQSTADFLCGEGHADLLQNNVCWEKSFVRNSTNHCNKVYASSAQELLNQNNHREMSQTEIDTWCSIINTSSTCMHDAVLENCDAEATSFVDKMMQKAMEKLMSFLKCQGEENVYASNNDTVHNSSNPSTPNRQIQPLEVVSNGASSFNVGNLQLGYLSRVDIRSLISDIISIVLILNFCLCNILDVF